MTLREQDKQICQCRISVFPGDVAEEQEKAAAKLMGKMAEEYVADKVRRICLFTRRDELLAELGLNHRKSHKSNAKAKSNKKAGGKTALKRPAASIAGNIEKAPKDKQKVPKPEVVEVPVVKCRDEWIMPPVALSMMEILEQSRSTPSPIQLNSSQMQETRPCLGDRSGWEASTMNRQ